MKKNCFFRRLNLSKGLICGVICLFISCNNDDIKMDEVVNDNLENSIPVSNLQVIAELVANIVDNGIVLEEVKQGVEMSKFFGLDEELRFTDILQPKESKMFRSSSANQLSQILRSLFNDHKPFTLRSSGDELETFVLDNNVQIYWPYSENWDGKEIPVVTFNNGSKNANNVTAYKKVTDDNGFSSIEKITVNEEYAKKHPVWVINENDLSYDDLPDFMNGEFEKNGVFFYSETASKKTTSFRASNSALMLESLQATKQYDDWLNGGSEFEFKLSQPLAPSYSTSGNNVYRISISRSDISNKKTFYPNYPLNTNWTVEQVQNGLKIVETDTGGSKNWSFNLGVKILGEDLSIAASIPYGSNDDHLFESILDRAYIESSVMNGPTKVFYSNDNGFNWRMHLMSY